MNRTLALGLALGWLAGVACSVALQTRAAPELELMLGQTKFRERECGTWFQCGPSSETKNGLISSSYTIGFKDTFAHGRYVTIGYRFGYTRLGDYSGNNWASVHDQDDHEVLNADTCQPDTARYCPALYKGSGRAQGIYFGPTIERSFGKLNALAGAGLFLFRSTYDVSVYHPYDNLFVPKGNSYEYNRATGDHVTWYWEVQLGYRLFRDASAVVLFRQYWNVYQQGDASRDGDVGLTGGRTRQVLAGIAVPF